MSKSCLDRHRDINDIPLSDEPDWLDDFHNALDKIDPKELREANSIAELALHLSLNGFSRDDNFSEGWIWYGLITWLPHLYIRASMTKINVRSVYGAGWRILKENGGELSQDQMTALVYKIARETYSKEDAAIDVIFRCISEFDEIDQDSKDRVFGFLARMKGSSSKIDAFAESFTKNLTKSIVPKNDIPEV